MSSAPRNVFTIKSFKKEFRDVYGSYQEVCQEFGFMAERTEESGSLARIVPRVGKGIRGSAFVIADVSEGGPNVFNEVGFARGLGKDVIMTAGKARTCRLTSATFLPSSENYKRDATYLRVYESKK